jgi:hypothetical protein
VNDPITIPDLPGLGILMGESKMDGMKKAA